MQIFNSRHIKNTFLWNHISISQRNSTFSAINFIMEKKHFNNGSVEYPIPWRFVTVPYSSWRDIDEQWNPKSQLKLLSLFCLSGSIDIACNESMWQRNVRDININPLPPTDAFERFLQKADPDQTALIKAAWSGLTLFMEIWYIWSYTIQGLTNNEPTWKFTYLIIHSGWNLAWILM